MPVPMELLMPFVIITAFYTVSGTGIGLNNRWREDLKPSRYGLDSWQLEMMERDRRLTGSKRGQTSDPKAPAAFSVNSIIDAQTPYRGSASIRM